MDHDEVDRVRRIRAGQPPDLVCIEFETSSSEAKIARTKGKPLRKGFEQRTVARFDRAQFESRVSRTNPGVVQDDGKFLQGRWRSKSTGVASRANRWCMSITLRDALEARLWRLRIPVSALPTEILPDWLRPFQQKIPEPGEHNVV